jgi:hypothetical protein
MSLKGYKVPTEQVVTKSADGEVTHTVRGLGAEAVSALVRSQGPAMRELYARALKGDFTEMDIEALLGVILDEAPLLVALTIAFGLDEPDEWSVAAELPFEDQVILVDAIVRLTFAREGGAKKVAEIIKGAMVRAVAANPLQPSANG